MTKLLSDPITPVFHAGSGIDPDEDAVVAMVEDEILEKAAMFLTL